MPMKRLLRHEITLGRTWNQGMKWLGVSNGSVLDVHRMQRLGITQDPSLNAIELELSTWGLLGTEQAALKGSSVLTVHTFLQG